MPTKKDKKRIKFSKRRLSAALIALVLLAATGAATVRQIEQRLQNRKSIVLAPVTQTIGCSVVDNLPDKDCTPGATWQTAKKQLCILGYSKLVRNVTESTKKQVFDRYGIAEMSRDDYEIDHLVSLQLGGSNDISNLWPLRTKIKDKKDRVENYLKRRICNNEISIDYAQTAIAEDWVKLHEQLKPVK